VASQIKKPVLDVQSLPDDRQIEIDKVGVKDLIYPIRILDRTGGFQCTVAQVNMYVNLCHRRKGTHMSRFVALLNEQCHNMTTTAIPRILKEMRTRLEATNAFIEVAFPYFLPKRAPVSNALGLVSYHCTIRGRISERVHLEIEVQVPVSTVCPSAMATDQSAVHNLRGLMTVRFRQNRFVWIEEIIELVESSACGDVPSGLKCVEEKFVAEKAFSPSLSIEDVTRAVASRLCAHEGIDWFSVETASQESIHGHNAYACLEQDCAKKTVELPKIARTA